MKKIILLLILFQGAISSGIFAQTRPASDSLWVIETRDGNTYLGTIADMRDSILQIKTSLGELRIPRAEVKSMVRPSREQVVNGNYWPENPQSSRHFFAPSGYGLRKGEGYYQNLGILFNQVSYGFSENLTVGVGIMPLFLFGAGQYNPIWITPKLSFPYRNERGSFGVGTILGGVVGVNEFAGLLYGVNTFGTREKQLTVGLGYFYSSGGIADVPIFNLGGMKRVGRKWVLVTENYLLVADGAAGGFISGGARYMTRYLAIDFGLFAPIVPDQDFFIALPWLGLAVPFGVR